MFPSSTCLSAECGGNWVTAHGLRILKPLYLEMLAFPFLPVFLPLGLITNDTQKTSFWATHAIDCHTPFHLYIVIQYFITSNNMQTKS